MIARTAFETFRKLPQNMHWPMRSRDFLKKCYRLLVGAVTFASNSTITNDIPLNLIISQLIGFLATNYYINFTRKSLFRKAITKNK